MNPEFLKKLDALRGYCGFPFVITSGYRSPSHSLEAIKEIPGTHAQGIAADIKITNSAHRYSLITAALEHGFTGIDSLSRPLPTTSIKLLGLNQA